MEVQINLRTFEQPMLVPVRLTDSQYISCGCESWRVGLLVCGIRHNEQDIDYRLGNETWDESRTDVLDPKRLVSQHSANTLSFTSEVPWPFQIVMDQLNWPVQHGGLAYTGAPDLLFRKGYLRVFLLWTVGNTHTGNEYGDAQRGRKSLSGEA
jgi:hypothetical protein